MEGRPGLWTKSPVPKRLAGAAGFGVQAGGMLWLALSLAMTTWAASGPERQLTVRKVDPCLHLSWTLHRPGRHPGGPGFWSLDESVETVNLAEIAGTSKGRGDASRSPVPEPVPEPPGPERRSTPESAPKWTIRPGDPVLVEQSGARVEARLRGVALGAAELGQMLPVRLMPILDGYRGSGVRIWVRAVGPRKTLWAEDRGGSQ